MQDCDEFPLLTEIFKKRPEAKMKFGLSRVRQALDTLRPNSLNVPTILIAGTNGKGTTSHYLSAFLELKNKKVARFTSPHLFSFSERFYISEEVGSLLLLEKEIQGIQQGLCSKEWELLSFFEIATLMALLRASESNVDWSILEVGLGGRLDSTNIARPDVTVIVSIGLDHQQYLGSTYREIAKEKAGILKPGIPVFLGKSPGQPWQQEALAEILDIAEELKCPVFRQGIDFGCEIQGELAHFWLRNRNFKKMILSGAKKNAPYLLSNACLAWAIAEYVLPHNPVASELSLENLGAGIIGRFEKRTIKGRPFIVDVCHNFEGVQQLCLAFEETLRPTVGNLPVVFTVLDDKSVQRMTLRLLESFESLILLNGSHERSFEFFPEKYASNKNIFVVDSITEAIEVIDRIAPSKRDIEAVVCGSILGLTQILQ